MRRARRAHEHKLRKLGYQRIAGADEAGRGAWAGPIVAAAVILPEHHGIRGIFDSKQLTPGERERLFPLITGCALAWGVSIIPHEQIDSEGIGTSNLRVLREAIEKLSPFPQVALVDAFKLSLKIPSISLIEGDVVSESIAAASIIAKVQRDRLMRMYDRQYPQYGFAQHKGYGTDEHYTALTQYGLLDIHRRSFEPMKYMVD